LIAKTNVTADQMDAITLMQFTPLCLINFLMTVAMSEALTL